jgi:hypothetical protein
MHPSRSARPSLFLALALVACGKPASDAKSPGATDGTASKPDGDRESIGGLAAEQGGLSALGGGGNREQSTGTEIAFAGPLRAETVSTKNPPKLDGVLKEWHARSPAKETLSGTTDGLDLEVAVQTAEDVLWVAGR